MFKQSLCWRSSSHFAGRHELQGDVIELLGDVDVVRLRLAGDGAAVIKVLAADTLNLIVCMWVCAWGVAKSAGWTVPGVCLSVATQARCSAERSCRRRAPWSQAPTSGDDAR